jgi:hypothetical protein
MTALGGKLRARSAVLWFEGDLPECVRDRLITTQGGNSCQKSASRAMIEKRSFDGFVALLPSSYRLQDLFMKWRYNLMLSMPPI